MTNIYRPHEQTNAEPHLCTDACGIYFDPDCPTWHDHDRLPSAGEARQRRSNRQRMGWLLDTFSSATPKEVAEFVALFWPVLCELLAEDLRDLIIDVMQERGRGERK